MQNEAVKDVPQLYEMKNDDLIWQMFASYVYVTVKQAQQILGCKIDYIQVRLRRLWEAGYLGRQQKSDFSEAVYFLTEKGGLKAEERGALKSPRWIQKKSPMTLDHDTVITDFHLRLDKALWQSGRSVFWQQWRNDLIKQFGEDIPDAYFCIISNDSWSPVRVRPKL